MSEKDKKQASEMAAFLSKNPKETAFVAGFVQGVEWTRNTAPEEEPTAPADKETVK